MTFINTSVHRKDWTGTFVWTLQQWRCPCLLSCSRSTFSPPCHRCPTRGGDARLCLYPAIPPATASSSRRLAFCRATLLYHRSLPVPSWPFMVGRLLYALLTFSWHTHCHHHHPTTPTGCLWRHKGCIPTSATPTLSLRCNSVTRPFVDKRRHGRRQQAAPSVTVAAPRGDIMATWKFWQKGTHFLFKGVRAVLYAFLGAMCRSSPA